MSNARELAQIPSTPSGRRNLIINGAMNVAQRGTSFSSSGYTLDRFTINLSGATATTTSENVTVGGESGLPVQFRKYLKYNVTTGNNNATVQHKVEDVTSVPEGKVTLSFYAKGTNPNGGSVMVYVSQIFGSGGSSEVAVTNPAESINLTSSWQRFTITLNVPSISGKTVGTGSYFWILIGQPSGDTSTNAWELDITGVQLEVGTVATEFEHRSFGEELALCQRYYYEVDSKGTGGSYPAFMAFRYNSTTNAYTGVLNHPTYMRTGPSVSFESGMRVHLPGLTIEAGTFSANLPDERSVAITINPGTTNNSGVIAVYPDGDGSNTKKIYVDAEL